MKPRQTEVSIPLQPPGRGPTPDAGPDGQPRDYVLWSLFNVLLGYALAYLGCLCFPALVFSIKARDCKVLGDLEGARRYGSRAKVLNIVCSVIMVLAVALVITAIITTVMRRRT
ncbi:dispanin subfamily A member 2b-like isoform X2 [Rissa tridactyla]|uniref:dispanin subfamily A member 2b-like isoform X2 n=1 Tax=Rissa tridactyla TaxID=75485 RepID=UPI0023BA61E9|nr:dispanin subfamily A member 2b-like isoform X2 [Rissa tridactyla]